MAIIILGTITAISPALGSQWPDPGDGRCDLARSDQTTIVTIGFTYTPNPGVFALTWCNDLEAGASWYLGTHDPEGPTLDQWNSITLYASRLLERQRAW